MLEHWRSAHYVCKMEAQEHTRLPAYKGSTLRGGFGYAFKQSVCTFERPLEQNCATCVLCASCPYPYVFETLAADSGQRIFEEIKEAPRPFVLEPPLDFRTDYVPGDILEFGLVLVGRGLDYLPFFVAVFERLGQMGLGMGRGRFRLREVANVDPLNNACEVIYRNDQRALADSRFVITFDRIEALAPYLPTDHLRVTFLTPTRLKHGGEIVTRPHFHVLYRSVLRRAALLYSQHCAPYHWDDAMGDLVRRAEQIQTTHLNVRWADWGRTSTRQKQNMKLGGVIGDAEYQGDFTGLLPLVLLGSLTHVGKAVTFGHGRFVVNPVGEHT